MKNPKNNFIYKLTDEFGVLEVFPFGENSFAIEYSRKEANANLDYEKALSGKITFVNEAFTRLMTSENSLDRCKEQKIEIFKNCNGVEKLIFSGRISLNEAEFNLDKCFITLKFMKDNSNECYEIGKSKKINVFPLIPNRITVQTKSFVSTFETTICTTSNQNDVQNGLFYWCGTGSPQDENWICTGVYQEINGSSYFIECYWIREIIEIICSEPEEPDWILIEDNCATTGKKKFAKQVETYNCKTDYEVIYDQTNQTNDIYKEYYSCDVLGIGTASTIIDNGISLKDFLTELLKMSCPDLIIKSDFFQINPDTITNINYVTGLKSKVNEIVIFQKSDVKRPNSANNATKFEVEFQEVIETLYKIFNVKWRIENGFFIIEHISFFAKNIGIDMTSEPLKKHFLGKNVYSYENAKIPKKEIFKFNEQSGVDWNLEVIYSDCVTNKSNNETKIIVDNAMTDILFAINNPSSDSDKVEDAGFVIVSTNKVAVQNGFDYYINSEFSANGRRLNNVFAWVQLFRDYHQHERPLKNGIVNNVQTNFISSIPTKKGVLFAIPNNLCLNNFNPDDVIITPLGNGIVSSAKQRLKEGFIELELLYQSN